MGVFGRFFGDYLEIHSNFESKSAGLAVFPGILSK